MTTLEPDPFAISPIGTIRGDDVAFSAYDRAIAYATDEGTQAGRNAAEWYVQDLTDGRIGWRGSDNEYLTARAILRGIEDGDPAVLDTFPHADLSGEWADTLTGPQLLQDAYADADPDHPADEAEFWHADTFTDVCDAYESAFNTAAEDAIASAARAILS